MTCGFDESDLLLSTRAHASRRGSRSKRGPCSQCARQEHHFPPVLDARPGRAEERWRRSRRSALRPSKCSTAFNQADLNTASICQVRASRSGRSLRYAGIKVACPARSHSSNSNPLPNSDLRRGCRAVVNGRRRRGTRRRTTCARHRPAASRCRRRGWPILNRPDVGRIQHRLDPRTGDRAVALVGAQKRGP